MLPLPPAASFLICFALSPSVPMATTEKAELLPSLKNVAVATLFLQEVRPALQCCLNPATQDSGWPALLRLQRISGSYRIGEKLLTWALNALNKTIYAT